MPFWSNLLALIDDEDINEELSNLFEELSEELQTYGDIAEEYSDFNHVVFTTFSPINSDEVDWRHSSLTTCILEYGVADKIAIEVESNDDKDEDNENENDVSQTNHREALNLLDWLVDVDGMSLDDTNPLLAIREKMERLSTKNTISFFVSKISFIKLTTAIDSTNDQNSMRRVI